MDNVEQAIQKIAQADKTKSTTLDLSGLGLSELPEQISQLTSLKTLFCQQNRLTDLTPLAKLTQLTILRCWGNKLSDLKPLAGLTKLTKLNCGDNQITTLEPLAGLTQLNGLGCQGNYDTNGVVVVKGEIKLWITAKS